MAYDNKCSYNSDFSEQNFRNNGIIHICAFRSGLCVKDRTEVGESVEKTRGKILRKRVRSGSWFVIYDTCKES